MMTEEEKIKEKEFLNKRIPFFIDDNSNIVIVISVGRISSAGTNWEQGYAYAKGKVVYVFQITDELTSLMTYNGCTYFINTNTDNVVQRVRDLLQKMKKERNYNYDIFRRKLLF